MLSLAEVPKILPLWQDLLREVKPVPVKNTKTNVRGSSKERKAASLKRISDVLTESPQTIRQIAERCNMPTSSVCNQIAIVADEFEESAHYGKKARRWVSK